MCDLGAHRREGCARDPIFLIPSDDAGDSTHIVAWAARPCDCCEKPNMGEAPMPHCSVKLYATIDAVASIPPAVLEIDLAQARAFAGEKDLQLQTAQQQCAKLIKVR